jgi:predicted SAM-dependent methyltransferase
MTADTRTAVRLNLGAGDDRRHGNGWVNVDQRPDVADVVCGAENLAPWDDGSVAEIQALDLLEHFWRDDVDAVLAEWRRVLHPGGLLTLRVPNLLALATQLVSVETTLTPNAVDAAGQLDRTIENIYGAHRWGPTHAPGAWDTHHWGYTPMTLERTLERAGFTVLSNDRRHNMTVVAQKEAE